MSTPLPIELDEIRQQISDTDQQLLGLLSKRRALALCGYRQAGAEQANPRPKTGTGTAVIPD